jgi:hypothetical protein
LAGLARWLRRDSACGARNEPALAAGHDLVRGCHAGLTRVRPWLAGGELTLAVWPGLIFAHRDESTHAFRSELRRAERTWMTFRWRPELRVAVDLGSGFVSRLRIRTRNIGLGSARPVPG